MTPDQPRSDLHDPNAKLDYGFDWSAWLDDGETIASATITPSSPDLTVHATDIGTTTVTPTISGGVVDRRYDITCHVVTSQGREDDRTRELVCRNR